jgi:hypothetical protein
MARRRVGRLALSGRGEGEGKLSNRRRRWNPSPLSSPLDEGEKRKNTKRLWIGSSITQDWTLDVD